MPRPLEPEYKLLRYMSCCKSYCGEVFIEDPLAVVRCLHCGSQRYHYLPALFPRPECLPESQEGHGDQIFATTAKNAGIGKETVPRE